MTFVSEDNPQFRSKFSEDIFKYKYQHEDCGTWESLSRTLAIDVCSKHVDSTTLWGIIEIIRDMEFIPGGRYIYYAGRPFRAFNNCLAGETKLLTDKGFVVLSEKMGETVNVLSPVDGEFYPAEVKSHGIQKLQKITFARVQGPQEHKWEVRATRTHHWPLVGGGDTYDLRVGDVVPANSFGCGEDMLGFAHGFVYGDGNANGQLRLCGSKVAWLGVLSGVAHSVTHPPSSEGDACLYFNQKIDWKALPENSKGAAYIGSFIRGWMAADGSSGAGCKMACVNRDAVLWFRENAAMAGIVITGKLRSQVRDVVLKGREYNNHEIFIQNYAWGDVFGGFKVVSIEPDGEDTVYCPYEPVHNRIVIDHNIDTYQCYLLRAEEDTREDWATLSWKAESCLATGGGIGVDYSVYRAKNSPLKRTGGVASGPVSKMRMINEIGREVMQGGSRRSAIYASLNWKHDDIDGFLKAKDWHSMPLPGTDKTFADAKQADFNFPCPLDMTNISPNYDTSWLEGYLASGDPGSTFLANCEQALRTGEPGWSFNFYEKENETLRNACCEVVSEDDSDVCNLGSVNLSRIDTLERLKEVTRLATIFLLCGTLEADLPYDKVRQIRAKNRRLGLGLMGVHEWLLVRGYKYEVVPELHSWLGAWQYESDKMSAEWSDKKNISRPVANRAIAPTGSIGILAGTTTGIEPIFAVAYKRRFLTDGTKWKYQYVVDSTAQVLVEKGVEPESIESALDLAKDYERRIKFQADVQDYVDMSISSTINMPAWGTKWNNPDTVGDFSVTLAKYARRLRGFTIYPDGARGGQPLTSVPYKEAVSRLGEEFFENVQDHDICDITNHGGSCGV